MHRVFPAAADPLSQMLRLCWTFSQHVLHWQAGPSQQGITWAGVWFVRKAAVHEYLLYHLYYLCTVQEHAGQ